MRRLFVETGNDDIEYRNTSLKADREDWGGILLKTPAKHRENERQRDHSHRGARGTKGTNEIP